MPARAIELKLTAKGKDERAISVSGYVHRGSVKYADRAFEKTVIYKRQFSGGGDGFAPRAHRRGAKRAVRLG